MGSSLWLLFWPGKRDTGHADFQDSDALGCCKPFIDKVVRRLVSIWRSSLLFHRTIQKPHMATGTAKVLIACTRSLAHRLLERGLNATSILPNDQCLDILTLTVMEFKQPKILV